jgi:hypothetical protein
LCGLQCPTLTYARVRQKMALTCGFVRDMVVVDNGVSRPQR